MLYTRPADPYSVNSREMRDAIVSISRRACSSVTPPHAPDDAQKLLAARTTRERRGIQSCQACRSSGTLASGGRSNRKSGASRQRPWSLAIHLDRTSNNGPIATVLALPQRPAQRIVLGAACDSSSCANVRRSRRRRRAREEVGGDERNAQLLGSPRR